MRKSRIAIFKTHCKRCGKEVYTTNRSITGADALKAELGSICQDCITPEEELRILHSTANSILEGSRK